MGSKLRDHRPALNPPGESNGAGLASSAVRGGHRLCAIARSKAATSHLPPTPPVPSSTRPPAGYWP